MIPKIKVQKVFKESDLVNTKIVKELDKISGGVFSLSEVFNPLISKLVNYNNKSVLSCSLDKLKRRFKLTNCDDAIFGLVDDLYKAGFSPILAGGKVLSYINGERFQDSNNDYDLFFTNIEDMDNCNMFLTRNDKFESLCTLGYVNEFLFSSDIQDETGKCLKFKIQLVCKEYACVEDVIENFDIRCCSVAYFKGNIFWIVGAAKDIKKKVLILNTPRVDEKVFVRIMKYVKKGYEISIPDLMCLSVLTLDSFFNCEKGYNFKNNYLQRVLDRDTIFDRSLGYSNLFSEDIFINTNEQGLDGYTEIGTINLI